MKYKERSIIPSNYVSQCSIKPISFGTLDQELITDLQASLPITATIIVKPF